MSSCSGRAGFVPLEVRPADAIETADEQAGRPRGAIDQIEARRSTLPGRNTTFFMIPLSISLSYVIGIANMNLR